MNKFGYYRQFATLIFCGETIAERQLVDAGRADDFALEVNQDLPDSRSAIIVGMNGHLQSGSAKLLDQGGNHQLPNTRIGFLNLPDLGYRLKLFVIVIDDGLHFRRIAALRTFEHFHVFAQDFECRDMDVIDRRANLIGVEPKRSGDSTGWPSEQQIIENRVHRDARALDLWAAAVGDFLVFFTYSSNLVSDPPVFLRA